MRTTQRERFNQQRREGKGESGSGVSEHVKPGTKTVCVKNSTGGMYHAWYTYTPFFVIQDTARKQARSINLVSSGALRISGLLFALPPTCTPPFLLASGCHPAGFRRLSAPPLPAFFSVTTIRESHFGRHRILLLCVPIKGIVEV